MRQQVEAQDRNDPKAKQRYIRRGMVFLLALLAIGSSILLFYQRQMVSSKKNGIVKIYQDGTLFMETSLYEDKTIPISYQETEKNVVCIEKGTVFIKEASCPDHICMNTGSITTMGLPIICLPNHLVIQIEYEEQEEGLFDAVSY